MYYTSDRDLELLNEEELAEYLEALEILVGGESAFDFIARLWPNEPVPKHMYPVIEAIERARVIPIRLAISIGPGHAKTTILLRALVWWLNRSGGDQCAYVTYSSAQAQDKSRIARDWAEESGLKLMTDAVGHWRIEAGGGLIAAGARGKLTGQRIPGILLYDDPYKDEFEARSKRTNNAVKERFKAIALTRLQGGSIIVVHTRWSENDLIGMITKELGWEYINIPTVCESEPDILGRRIGETAWPEKYPYKKCDGPCSHDGHIEEIREGIGEHLYASMFQGRPRPKGSAIFHEPSRFKLSEFSWVGRRGVISIDPAATAKTSADWSVLVVAAMHGYGSNSVMHIVDLVRLQKEIPEVLEVALRLQRKYGLMMACEGVGGFKGVPQMLKKINPNLRILSVNKNKDKLSCALPMSAAWNSGRVLVPIDVTWADALIEEHGLFTGQSTDEDDQVDGCSQAWNVLYKDRPKVTEGDYAAGGM